MKLFQKQEQDKQRAMDMLQGSFDMQLAVLRNLQAKRAAHFLRCLIFLKVYYLLWASLAL